MIHATSRSKQPIVNKDPDASYQHGTPPTSTSRNASSTSDTTDHGGCSSAIHAACFKVNLQQHHHQSTRWQDSSTLYTHFPTGMQQSSDTTTYDEHFTGDGDHCKMNRQDYKDSLVGFKWYNDPPSVLHGPTFSSCDTWRSIDHDDSYLLKHSGENSRPMKHPIHPAWVSKPDLADSIRNDCLAPDDGSWCAFSGASPPGNKEPSLEPLNCTTKSLQPLLDPGSDTSFKNRYDSGGGGGDSQKSRYWMHGMSFTFITFLHDLTFL